MGWKPRALCSKVYLCSRTCTDSAAQKFYHNANEAMEQAITLAPTRLGAWLQTNRPKCCATSNFVKAAGA